MNLWIRPAILGVTNLVVGKMQSGVEFLLREDFACHPRRLAVKSDDGRKERSLRGAQTREEREQRVEVHRKVQNTHLIKFPKPEIFSRQERSRERRGLPRRSINLC